MLKPAIEAISVPERKVKSNYPAPFAAQMEGRIKRVLGDVFGLTNFGVNLTTILPGGGSSLLHEHTLQDEFIYVLEGTLELVTEDGTQTLVAGMCVGFPHAQGAHTLRNVSGAPATYLEIGDRTPGDMASYPQDDLKATKLENGWAFTHKDGTPYAK